MTDDELHEFFGWVWDCLHDRAVAEGIIEADQN